MSGARLSFRSPPLWLAAAALVTAACYWPGLGGPLLLDDLPNLAPLFDWLDGNATWQAVVFGNHAGPLGRPAAMATFLANGWLAGPSTWALKLGNLLIHLVVGALVFAVLRRLLRRDRLLAPHAEAVAAFLACVWLVHPIHASTVLYVVQRMAQLSALFVLLALWLFVHARERLERGENAAAALLLGVPALTLLAALAKENGALAPLLCLAIELGYFRAGPRPRAVSVFFGIFVLLPALATLAVLLGSPMRLLAGYEVHDFTLLERLLSETRALWRYLGTLVTPNSRLLGIFGDDFALSHGLLDPPATLVAIVAWIAVLAAAVRARLRAPAVLTGLLFFLFGHALESSIFPLELYFEHRNYLPAVGALLAAAGGVAAIAERRPLARGAALAGAVAIVAALAFATHSRAWIWQRHDLLAAETLRAHPGSLRARTEYATLLVQGGRVPDALAVIAPLAQSASADERLLAQLYRTAIECRFMRGGSAADLDAMRALERERLTMRDISAIELLTQQVQGGYCGFEPRAFADLLVELADASRQRESAHPRWKTRALAAELYSRNPETAGAARAQAERAWASGAASPSLGLLLARLRITAGDLAGAAALTRDLERRMPVYASAERAELATIEKELAATPPH